MNAEIEEYFYLLREVCRADDSSLGTAYRQLRELLEHLCRTQMTDSSLQMTDLAARINFVSSKLGLTVVEQNRLHTFRLASNAVLNRQAEPSREKLLRDAKTVSFFVKRITGEDIPADLYRLFPQADATYIAAPPAKERVRRMRVNFQYADTDYLYVLPVDSVADEPLRVRYNVPQINDEFAETCGLLWRHAQINLLDVAVDGAGVLTPSFIILEPDYLLDISSLAECFREYGHHPANYMLARLQMPDNTRPLLLGNIANLFLDEWIHAESEPDYLECMKKAFRSYPIELAACADLRDREKEREFFADCKRHFDNIRQTVTDTFRASGYELDKTDAVLEPSYICEALGLQGRLDYMQRDMSSFIEMKSGKADEYAIRGKVEPKENNRVQMLLYQAVLEYALGKNSGKANIRKNLEDLGLQLDEDAMRKVTERIIELGDKKELVTQEDLPYIVSDVLKHGMAEERVSLKSYIVNLAYGLKPMATLKIEINGKEYEESSSGDGQYDAFVRALRKIYKVTLGRKFPMLTNYAVTIPPGGRTDAFVQTVITWSFEDTIFRTRGLDADQTEAAIKATVKMLNIIEDEYES